jgi:hypothetical protein
LKLTQTSIVLSKVSISSLFVHVNYKKKQASHFNNTMMPNKKKTNYESKGFVRRIAGSIFSSRGGGGGISGSADDGGISHIPVMMLASTIGKGGSDGNSNKWRPRKKQFERLDVEDEEDSFLAEGNHWMGIKSVESTESDAGEYKRAILYERKTAALKQTIMASTGASNDVHYNLTSNSSGKKRDLSDFNIKPPTKDTTTNRVGSVSKKKISKRIPSNAQSCVMASNGQSLKNSFLPVHSTMVSTNRFDQGQNVSHGTIDDNYFGSSSGTHQYHKVGGDDSSRHTASSNTTGSSKHTRPSLHHPSYNTVTSDPSDFFSKDVVTTLTQQNLARLAATSAAQGTIPEEHRRYGAVRDNSERSNSRTKFYQFAIDEDKESTVVESNVLPLTSYGEDDDKLFGEAAVGSYDEEEENSDDDASELYGSIATKETRIQIRSPTASKSFTDGHNISYAEIVKNDSFFENAFADSKHTDTVVEDDDDTFADLIQSKKKSKHSDRNAIFDFPELDPNDDHFFSPKIQETTLPQGERLASSYGRQPSAQSLAYSPSPRHHRNVPEGGKLLPPPATRPRDARLPLSPLSNVKLAAGKSHPSLFIPRLPSTTNRGANDDLPMFGAKVEGRERKPDPDESWINVAQDKTSKKQFIHQSMIKKPDPYSQFNATFGTVSSKTLLIDNSTSTKKQRRDPSISSSCHMTDGFEDPNTSDLFIKNNDLSDPFVSMEDDWGFDENVAPKVANVPDKCTTKTNLGMKTISKNYINGDGPSWESTVKKPNLMGFPSNGKRTPVAVNDEFVDIDSSSEDEEDIDGNNGNDDDSFNSVALWERSSAAVPMGIQSFPKDSSTRSNAVESRNFHSNSLSSRSGSDRSARSRVVHGRCMAKADAINADCADDTASVGKVSASGSYTKPLALPSNAIMASMLFRAHYDSDKTTVEKKIKAKEEEHVKYQKSRRGDIPDAVLADHDYMTTISSFSDGTMGFQEAWKKPSRDLLDYFSKARALDMESKRYLQSHQVHNVKNATPLFEA